MSFDFGVKAFKDFQFQKLIYDLVIDSQVDTEGKQFPLLQNAPQGTYLS